MNLGGPDSLEAVEPFLVNLFTDPDIIPFPLVRGALARFIARRRAPLSRTYYEEIGGRSPILPITERQARALEERLRARGVEARCYIAMRYWHPLTEAAIEAMRKDGVREAVALPMYPQYSTTTTGSSLKALRARAGAAGITLREIESYPEHPAYLDAVEARLREALGGRDLFVLFSAHGVPESVIRKGDPYERQTRRTVAALVERMKLSRWALAWQSKVGPVKWLGPSTDAELRRLAADGVREVAVAPVSFTAECVETLQEIGGRFARLAKELGYTTFVRVPAVDDHPRFIEALADLVTETVAVTASVTVSATDAAPAAAGAP